MTSSVRGKHVPIVAQCIDHTARLAGVSSRRFFTDAPVFARTQMLVTEYYGFDAPSYLWDVYNIESEAMGQKLVYHPDGIPDVDRADPLIKSPSDLDKIRAPDPYKSGRMPWVHRINKIFKEMTGRPARAFFCAPFSLAANIRGYENLVNDMYENPRFAHRLFQFLCDEVLVPYIEAIRNEAQTPELPADGADAWASLPMITLDMMDEYVVAYTERLRRKLGDRLVTMGHWGDAKSRDVERFMAQKLKCSPAFLRVLDPDLYEVGPERVKAFANEHNALVIAGVDAMLLREGQAEAVVERIKYYIDTMARDGRAIIFLNQIPAEAPPENVHAAVAACHTYGRLPIPENLDDVKFEVPERESFSEFLSARGERIEDLS